MPEAILERVRPRVEEARATAMKRVEEVRERVGTAIGAPRGSPPRILEGLKEQWAERPILKRVEERRKAMIAGGRPILGIMRERKVSPPSPEIHTPSELVARTELVAPITPRSNLVIKV